MSLMRLSTLSALVFSVALTVGSTAALAQNRTFSFAYDQPKSSGYGAGAEMFDKKLKELSKGTLSINQYPSAQLGTEAQTMQKVQTGDIDFVMLSTANASTAQPESGVFSIHFIFRDEKHAIKVLGDPTVITALQTGVVDMAENGINNYLINKHYEPAPVLSLTEHEANNAALFISDKAWSSLSDEQKKWVLAAADEVSQKEPAAAFELEHQALAKLEKMGVKIVKDVDKSGFSQISKPIQDKLASDLGPHAVKVLGLVRKVQ